MTSIEECESIGKIFVPSHENGKGGYTRAYCRKRRFNEPGNERIEIREIKEQIIEPEPEPSGSPEA